MSRGALRGQARSRAREVKVEVKVEQEPGEEHCRVKTRRSDAAVRVKLELGMAVEGDEGQRQQKNASEESVAERMRQRKRLRPSRA